ncbi:MAG: aspartate aminotransferase family protein [Verrucomicrobiota bacterium]|nr:aspartate aminotransferase family protein [Verrucomicrobiota bacterium]
MNKNISFEKIKSLSEEFIMPTYRQSLCLEKGKGIYLYSSDGRVFLDFTSGIAVTNLGHCHPEIIDTICNQSNELMHASNLFYNKIQPQLAEQLVECTGLENAKCFFCNSGAEANEGMIKLARLWGSCSNKYEIITMKQSFHGRTLATLTATGQDKVKKGFGPLPKGFVYADYNNLDSVESLINSSTVAVMIESIQGEGGVIPADKIFLRKLRDLCDNNNILLLCDEVQAGIGRTGKWFGFQHADIKPDVISSAKGLGNGFPIGALIAKAELSNIFQPGNHATTFGGNPLSSAVSLKVIEIIKNDNLLSNAERMGLHLKSKLSKELSKFEWIENIRGLGLMLGIVLNVEANYLQKKLEENGLLAIATAGNILRMLPPMIISIEEVNKAIDLIIKSCNDIDNEMKNLKKY